MKQRNIQKWVFIGLLLFVLGIGGFFAVLGVRNYRVYTATQNNSQAVQAELESLQKEVHKQEVYLKRLLTDPVFFESVVRKRLGYTQEDEVVYRFEEERESPRPLLDLGLSK